MKDLKINSLATRVLKVHVKKKYLRKVFKQDIPQSPTVALLGAIPKGMVRKAQKHLLNILLAAALKCITTRWLKPDPPTYNLWIQNVWDLYQMEQITHSLRLQRSTFTKRCPVMTLLIQ